MRYLFFFAALLFSTTAFAQVDSDGDGVDDAADLCDGIDASFFDADGDGCIDPTANARHREFWDPADLPLTYVIHENGAPGIGGTSDFDAIQNGFAAWTVLPDVALSATYAGTTPEAAASGMDGINQVTFEDPDFLAVYGSAVLAVGITTSYDVPTPRGDGTTLRPGQIFDADMIFNPVREFATDSAGSGIDLQSVATHEAGHLFGIAHSTVVSSTMFPALPTGIAARTLEPEDVLVAFMSAPAPGSLGTASVLSGTLRSGADLSPVGGAAVVAISVATGDTLGGQYTLADGTWEFTGLVPGDYFVAVAPLEGAAANGVVPGLVNSYVESIATNLVWPGEYWNLAESAGDDPLDSDSVSLGAAAVVSGIDILTNVDLVPPSLVELAPAESAPIRSDALFFIRFSEEMDFASATTSLTLARVDGATQTQLPFGLVQVAEGDVFIIDPAAPLEHSRDYEVTVLASISDRSGNPLGTEIVRHFTTEPAPVLEITTVSPTSVVAGTVVVIYGEGFDTVDPSANRVSFGGVEVSAATATPNAITAAVPEGIPAGGFDLWVLLGAQTSSTLAMERAEPVDVVRGTDYATMSLAGDPTGIELLPDGNFAYVGTSAGIAVATTAISALDFGTHEDIALPFGIADLAVAPDGKRVYAVSGNANKLLVLDSDYGDLAARNPTFNSVIDELETTATPTGIAVDPAGERAYVSTAAGTIEIWDIETGSATWHRPVGQILSPVPSLQGALAVDAAGLNLFALTGSGDLLVFDLEDPTATPGQHPVAFGPNDLALDPRGTVGYVTDSDGSVAVVQLASGLTSQLLNVGGNPQGFTVDPSGARGWIANRANDEIQVLDLVNGSPSFRTITGAITTGALPVDVAVLPNGLFILSAEAGSQVLRLIGIGAGPQLTGVDPVAGRPGDWFVISGDGFAPTGEGILSALERFENPEEELPFTRVWFGDTEVRPLSATGSKVAVQAPDDWTGEPVRVTWNGPPVQGQPNALFSNPLTIRLLAASEPDLSETVDRAVFMGADNGYPWAAPGLSGALAVSPSGDFALVGEQGGRIYMVDIDAAGPNQGQVVGSLMPASTPKPGLVVVAPDGLRAWYAGQDENVHEIDTDPDSPGFLTEVGILTDEFGVPPTFVPGDLHVTPSGNLLVVEDRQDGGVCVFRIRGEQPHDFDYPVFSEPDGIPQALAIHPSGLWSVYAADDEFHRVSLNPNRLVFGSQTATRGASGTVVDLTFTPDGEALAVVYWSPDDGGSYWLQLRRPWLMTAFALRPNSLHQLVAGVPLGEATIEISPNGDRAIIDLPAAGQIKYADLSYAYWARIQDVGELARTSTASRMEIGFDPMGLGVYLAGEGDPGVEFLDFANSAGGTFISGLGQVGLAGETLPSPVLFRVADDQGQPSAGAVAEVYADGGGTLGNGSPYQWLTANPDGVISIQWTMGPDVDGDPASPANALRVTLNGGATPAENVEVPSVEDPATLPLNLVELLPPDGSIDVSVSTSILARFSRAVDPATATTPEFLLRRADDQTAVQVAWGYADGNRNASMVPSVPLIPLTTYEIVVGAGIVDSDGGAVTNPVVASFTTETLPVLAIASLSPPSAVPGIEIVIAGSRFGDDLSAVSVDFNGTIAPVSGGGPDFLTAYVPVGATSGPVRVGVGAAQSNALPFAVLLPEAAPLDQVVTTVETGSPVQSLVVTPDGTKAYSVNSQVNRVVPVDMLTFMLGTPIEVGIAPSGIAIHPDGSTVYVANYGSGTVSVIDVATDLVVETINVGNGPRDIVSSPNGDWLYVVDPVDQILSVIDIDGSSAAYHTVVATAPTSRSTKGAAIRPDGTLLYLGTDDGFLIFDLDPSAYGVVATAPTSRSTKGAAIRPDGSLLFLLTTTNEVLVVDVSEGGSNAVVASVETDANASAAAISPDGTRLFLLQEGSAEVYVYEIVVDYNVSSTASIGSITVRTVLLNVIPVPPEPGVIAIDPSGSGIVVIGHGTDDGLLTFLNSSSYVRESILADLTLAALEIDPVWGGRAVVFRICLPDGLDVRDVDVASLVLEGSVPALPGSARIETLPGSENECLVVGFDRLAFQALIPPPTLGRQLQPPEGSSVFSLTGSYGADAIGMSASVFVHLERAVLLTPVAGDGFWPGRPMYVSWLTPAGVEASVIDVRFTENGGASWFPLVSGLPNDGDQWFASPGGISEEGLLEVVFRDTEGQVSAIAITEGFFRLNTQAVRVTMGEVNLQVNDGAGLIRWSVADPQALDGFQVLRSTEEDGDYRTVSEAVVGPNYGPDGTTFVFADDGILGNRDYFYMLQEVRPDGEEFLHGPYRLNWALRNELKQNVPNSFNPRTTISFSIAEDGPVRLAVYNIAGRLVNVLVDERLQANTHQVIWEGKDQHGRQVASGVYLYHLSAPGFSAARKMALVR